MSAPLFANATFTRSYRGMWAEVEAAYRCRQSDDAADSGYETEAELSTMNIGEAAKDFPVVRVGGSAGGLDA